MRGYYNYLVTGGAGTGKTVLALSLRDTYRLKYINIRSLALNNRFVIRSTRNSHSPKINWGKVIRYLRPMMRRGNYVIESRDCSRFPSYWFRVVCLTHVDTSVLLHRLNDREWNLEAVKAALDKEERIQNIDMHDHPAYSRYKWAHIFKVRMDTWLNYQRAMPKIGYSVKIFQKQFHKFFVR